MHPVLCCWYTCEILASFLPQWKNDAVWSRAIDSEKKHFTPLENVKFPFWGTNFYSCQVQESVFPTFQLKPQPASLKGCCFGQQLLNTLRSSLCFSSLGCFLSACAAQGTDSSQYKYEPESHYEGTFSEKPNTIGMCGDIPKRVQSSLRQEWIQELKLSLLYSSYFWLCGLVWLHFLLLRTAMGCRECHF